MGHLLKGVLGATVGFLVGGPAGSAAALAGAFAGGVVGSGILSPGAPKVPALPKPPTLDTATQGSLDNQDQIARRKGVIANVFAGGNAAPPSVGKTTLGG